MPNTRPVDPTRPICTLLPIEGIIPRVHVSRFQNAWYLLRALFVRLYHACYMELNKINKVTTEYFQLNKLCASSFYIQCHQVSLQEGCAFVGPCI